MKKTLILLLAVMMFITSCGTPAGDVSSSQEPESSVSEVSQPDEKVELKGLRTLISVGKSYTLAYDAAETYPDYFSQQLTDGIKAPDVGAHYTDPRTVGFGGKPMNVTIDLGDDGKNITEIAARALEMSMDGVGLATKMTVYGSNDGVTFDGIGEGRFEKGGDKTMRTCSVILEKPVDYRYIRVVVERGTFFFIFLDEVEVYADLDPKEKADTVTLSYQNDNLDRNEWKELSTGNIATPVSTKNLALDLGYTFKNCEFDERAPKNTTHLTDGARTKMLFGQDAWVGIRSNGTDIPSVNIKLKSQSANIYGFRVHALGAGYDVKYPDYIDVYGSTNGKEYTFIGRMYAPQDCDHYAYTLVLTEYIKAKLFRFEFPAEEANYWIEEIEILAGYNEETDSSIYPDLCFPTVTEDVYWESSEDDYTTRQNLLIGANQQIAAMYYDSEDILVNHSYKNSPFDFEGLADGKRAKSTDCYSGEYFFSYNTSDENIGYSNCLDFFYDIGKISAIEELNVHLLEHSVSGITRPSFITVYLSEDGDNWYEVGNYTMPLDEVLSETATNLSFNFPLETAYAARFVRFRVEEPKNPKFIFIDELEAIGTKKVDSSVKKISESGIDSVIYYTNTEREQYASVENTTVNSQHQVLYIPDKGDETTLLPMVAYLDEEGNIKDTMFDGFICWGASSYPSGCLGFQESYMQDWEHLFNITFNGVNGLDKLDEVVGQVKEALNIPDYTVKVYISTLTIHDTVTDFGDVDGDGISENLSVAADRKKVIDWYLKLYTDEFAKRDYKNIVLDGVNYIDESIHLEVDNSHIVDEIGQAVKAIGTNYIWIPYYAAARFYIGNDLNFDTVCMQINYVFTNDAPEWRISSTAEMTKRLQMSIEMEHSFQCLGDKSYARQYMKYLLNGVIYGYIDGIHMYYNDIDNFSRMAYSTDSALCRMQYDATYEYIKGTIQVFPEARETLKLSTEKDTIIRGSFNENDALELYTLVKQPEHGYVALNEEGDYVYYPEKGYTGTDTFSYTYNEYLGESDECVVEITVG